MPLELNLSHFLKRLQNTSRFVVSIPIRIRCHLFEQFLGVVDVVVIASSPLVEDYLDLALRLVHQVHLVPYLQQYLISCPYILYRL